MYHDHDVIARSTTGLPDNLETSYISQSGNSITIPCSYEPGSLLNCYYGEWLKDGYNIVIVETPRIGDCAPGEIMTTDPDKYELRRDTFSLTINSLEADTDSGNYSCQLRVLDPAGFGDTVSFPLPRPLSLIVTGKQH